MPMKKGDGDARGGHYYLSERARVECRLHVAGYVFLYYSLRLWNVENHADVLGTGNTPHTMYRPEPIVLSSSFIFAYRPLGEFLG